jgi:hypothetical protein
MIDRARTIISQLVTFKLLYNVKTSLQMVCYTPQSGFYTSPISIKRPHIKDLRLNYGHEFAHVHEKLLCRLREPDSSGIAFLHGLPVSVLYLSKSMFYSFHVYRELEKHITFDILLMKLKIRV